MHTCGCIFVRALLKWPREWLGANWTNTGCVVSLLQGHVQGTDRLYPTVAGYMAGARAVRTALAL